jgi:hypothetical protein
MLPSLERKCLALNLLDMQHINIYSINKYKHGIGSQDCPRSSISTHPGFGFLICWLISPWPQDVNAPERVTSGRFLVGSEAAASMATRPFLSSEISGTGRCVDMEWYGKPYETLKNPQRYHNLYWDMSSLTSHMRCGDNAQGANKLFGRTCFILLPTGWNWL